MEANVIVLRVNLHIWPLTYLCDLCPQNIMEANIGHLPTKFGYKQMQGWKVINRYRVLRVNLHIWPLTYLCDLWPQNIMEVNIEHLSTKFGYKQMQGWKVIQVFVSVMEPLSHTAVCLSMSNERNGWKTSEIRVSTFSSPFHRRMVRSVAGGGRAVRLPTAIKV